MPGRRTIVLAIAVAACNYDWTYRAPDGGTSPSTQKDGGGDPGDPNDSGGGEKSPCFAGKETCPEGQYCRFTDRTCGTSANGEGVCLPVGTDCKSEPVCTCKGTFEDGCIAQKNGIDVDEKGFACGTKGDFVCGSMTCTSGKELCVTQTGNSKCTDATSCVDCKCPGFEACLCEEKIPGEIRIECK